LDTILTLLLVAVGLVVGWYVVKLLLIAAIYLFALILLPFALIIDSAIRIVRNTK
jgi:hypothetical protein